MLCIQLTVIPPLPAEEACLKDRVWNPASSNSSSSLPVLFNIHVRDTWSRSKHLSKANFTEAYGGGVQYDEATRDDHGNWISHDQEFVGVSIGYRLGLLSLMARATLTSANTGLLDQRRALVR